MESKSLLYGIIGFIAGGLVVAIAATIEQPAQHPASRDDLAMSTMNESLEKLSGDAYDKAFITHMIAHHQGAIDMAKLSDERAGHAEIKQFSRTIIDTQSTEISTLKTWQQRWGYTAHDAREQ